MHFAVEADLYGWGNFGFVVFQVFDGGAVVGDDGYSPSVGAVELVIYQACYPGNNVGGESGVFADHGGFFVEDDGGVVLELVADGGCNGFGDCGDGVVSGGCGEFFSQVGRLDGDKGVVGCFRRRQGCGDGAGGAGGVGHFVGVDEDAVHRSGHEDVGAVGGDHAGALRIDCLEF